MSSSNTTNQYYSTYRNSSSKLQPASSNFELIRDTLYKLLDNPNELSLPELKTFLYHQTPTPMDLLSVYALHHTESHVEFQNQANKNYDSLYDLHYAILPTLIRSTKISIEILDIFIEYLKTFYIWAICKVYKPLSKYIPLKWSNDAIDRPDTDYFSIVELSETNYKHHQYSKTWSQLQSITTYPMIDEVIIRFSKSNSFQHILNKFYSLTSLITQFNTSSSLSIITYSIINMESKQLYFNSICTHIEQLELKHMIQSPYIFAPTQPIDVRTSGSIAQHSLTTTLHSSHKLMDMISFGNISHLGLRSSEVYQIINTLPNLPYLTPCVPNVSLFSIRMNSPLHEKVIKINIDRTRILGENLLGIYDHERQYKYSIMPSPREKDYMESLTQRRKKRKDVYFGDKIIYSSSSDSDSDEEDISPPETTITTTPASSSSSSSSSSTTTTIVEVINHKLLPQPRTPYQYPYEWYKPNIPTDQPSLPPIIMTPNNIRSHSNHNRPILYKLFELVSNYIIHYYGHLRCSIWIIKHFRIQPYISFKSSTEIQIKQFEERVLESYVTSMPKYCYNELRHYNEVDEKLHTIRDFITLVYQELLKNPVALNGDCMEMFIYCLWCVILQLPQTDTFMYPYFVHLLPKLDYVDALYRPQHSDSLVMKLFWNNPYYTPLSTLTLSKDEKNWKSPQSIDDFFTPVIQWASDFISYPHHLTHQYQVFKRKHDDLLINGFKTQEDYDMFCQQHGIEIGQQFHVQNKTLINEDDTHEKPEFDVNPQVESDDESIKLKEPQIFVKDPLSNNTNNALPYEDCFEIKRVNQLPLDPLYSTKLISDTQFISEYGHFILEHNTSSIVSYLLSSNDINIDLLLSLIQTTHQFELCELHNPFTIITLLDKYHANNGMTFPYLPCTDHALIGSRYIVPSFNIGGIYLLTLLIQRRYPSSVLMPFIRININFDQEDQYGYTILDYCLIYNTYTYAPEFVIEVIKRTNCLYKRYTQLEHLPIISFPSHLNCISLEQYHQLIDDAKIISTTTTKTSSPTTPIVTTITNSNTSTTKSSSINDFIPPPVNNKHHAHTELNPVLSYLNRFFTCFPSDIRFPLRIVSAIFQKCVFDLDKYQKHENNNNNNTIVDNEFTSEEELKFTESADFGVYLAPLIENSVITWPYLLRLIHLTSFNTSQYMQDSLVRPLLHLFIERYLQSPTTKPPSSSSSTTSTSNSKSKSKNKSTTPTPTTPNNTYQQQAQQQYQFEQEYQPVVLAHQNPYNLTSNNYLQLTQCDIIYVIYTLIDVVCQPNIIDSLFKYLLPTSYYQLFYFYKLPSSFLNQLYLQHNETTINDSRQIAKIDEKYHRYIQTTLHQTNSIGILYQQPYYPIPIQRKGSHIAEPKSIYGPTADTFIETANDYFLSFHYPYINTTTGYSDISTENPTNLQLTRFQSQNPRIQISNPSDLYVKWFITENGPIHPVRENISPTLIDLILLRPNYIHILTILFKHTPVTKYIYLNSRSSSIYTIGTTYACVLLSHFVADMGVYYLKFRSSTTNQIDYNQLPLLLHLQSHLPLNSYNSISTLDAFNPLISLIIQAVGVPQSNQSSTTSSKGYITLDSLKQDKTKGINIKPKVANINKGNMSLDELAILTPTIAPSTIPLFPIQQHNTINTTTAVHSSLSTLLLYLHYLFHEFVPIQLFKLASLHGADPNLPMLYQQTPLALYNFHYARFQGNGNWKEGQYDINDSRFSPLPRNQLSSSYTRFYDYGTSIPLFYTSTSNLDDNSSKSIPNQYPNPYMMLGYGGSFIQDTIHWNPSPNSTIRVITITTTNDDKKNKKDNNNTTTTTHVIDSDDFEALERAQRLAVRTNQKKVTIDGNKVSINPRQLSRNAKVKEMIRKSKTGEDIQHDFDPFAGTGDDYDNFDEYGNRRGGKKRTTIDHDRFSTEPQPFQKSDRPHLQMWNIIHYILFETIWQTYVWNRPFDKLPSIPFTLTKWMLEQQLPFNHHLEQILKPLLLPPSSSMQPSIPNLNRLAPPIQMMSYLPRIRVVMNDSRQLCPLIHSPQIEIHSSHNGFNINVHPMHIILSDPKPTQLTIQLTDLLATNGMRLVYQYQHPPTSVSTKTKYPDFAFYNFITLAMFLRVPQTFLQYLISLSSRPYCQVLNYPKATNKQILERNVEKVSPFLLHGYDVIYHQIAPCPDNIINLHSPSEIGFSHFNATGSDRFTWVVKQFEELYSNIFVKKVPTVSTTTVRKNDSNHNSSSTNPQSTTPTKSWKQPKLTKEQYEIKKSKQSSKGTVKDAFYTSQNQAAEVNVKVQFKSGGGGGGGGSGGSSSSSTTKKSTSKQNQQDDSLFDDYQTYKSKAPVDDDDDQYYDDEYYDEDQQYYDDDGYYYDEDGEGYYDEQYYDEDDEDKYYYDANQSNNNQTNTSQTTTTPTTTSNTTTTTTNNNKDTNDSNDNQNTIDNKTTVQKSKQQSKQQDEIAVDFDPSWFDGDEDFAQALAAEKAYWAQQGKK